MQAEQGLLLVRQSKGIELNYSKHMATDIMWNNVKAKSQRTGFLILLWSPTQLFCNFSTVIFT